MTPRSVIEYDRAEPDPRDAYVARDGKKDGMTRRLVACSDGTWYTADRNTPGNVVEMVRSVLPQAPDGTDQILFYDPGVGTGGVFDKYSGGMFGSGLSKNVLDVYRFLVHNYVEGDEIYLFGFSRGAYTVRSAAGLIRNCGLLHKEHAGRANEAFRIYRERDEGPDTADAIHFREKYSRQPLRIKFIGVWDTVGALGIPVDFLRFLMRPARRGGYEVSFGETPFNRGPLCELEVAEDAEPSRVVLRGRDARGCGRRPDGGIRVPEGTGGGARRPARSGQRERLR